MSCITAVSLFSGAGGLDLGFVNQGYKLLWANDVKKDACQTHKLWSPDCVIINDKIENIDSKDIPEADVILGGFPCQGFSLSGPRKLDDSRNKLYKEFVRIVKDKQPKVFVGENVLGLLSMSNGEVLEAIIEDFSRCGYKVLYELVNAKNYGVPQDRKRVIIVGVRNDIEFNSLCIPKSNRIITIGEALREGIIPLSTDICQDAYSSRYMSRNRKRTFDQVSFTIPAMAKQVPLHPSSPDMIQLEKDKWIFGEGVTRRLSYQEAALIQTFPLDFIFEGNLTSKYQQIGNAVPVKLAEAIAIAIKKILKGDG